MFSEENGVGKRQLAAYWSGKQSYLNKQLYTSDTVHTFCTVLSQTMSKLTCKLVFG